MSLCFFIICSSSHNSVIILIYSNIDPSMQNPMPDTQEIGIKEEGDLGGIRDDDGISELEQLLKQKTFTRKVLQTINMISFFFG